ncbi:hypothetical protein GQ54DRAFT_80778 [Martensiomyces pterosporus]|nr:hypothetical protein GQ54DRAFT_80778 [Martensiomyces pterosporus]
MVFKHRMVDPGKRQHRQNMEIENSGPSKACLQNSIDPQACTAQLFPRQQQSGGGSEWKALLSGSVYGGGRASGFVCCCGFVVCLRYGQAKAAAPSARAGRTPAQAVRAVERSEPSLPSPSRRLQNSSVRATMKIFLVHFCRSPANRRRRGGWRRGGVSGIPLCPERGFTVSRARLGRKACLRSFGKWADRRVLIGRGRGTHQPARFQASLTPPNWLFLQALALLCPLL